MKGFSATSFAGEHEAALDQASAAVRKDPLALVTDFQWFYGNLKTPSTSPLSRLKS